MKDTILMWLLGIGGVVGGGVLAFAVKKFGPGLIHKFLGGAIKKAMDFDEGSPIVNEARKRMILAQMVYLELKIPNRGQGQSRKDAIIASIGPKAGPIVDELLSQLDEELFKLKEEFRTNFN